jgi:protein N-terminal methyltransferase
LNEHCSHIDDFCLFFGRCKKGLKPNGIIGIKENLTVAGVQMDEEDSSVTRSDEILKALFFRAGLRLIKEELQKGFPKKLFQVKMYILEPL